MISAIRKAGSWRRIVGNQEVLCEVLEATGASAVADSAAAMM
jgi:hypothetical protein